MMKFKGSKAVLAILIVFAGVAHDASAKKTPPNVLMICVDDMNDWVGFLGGHPQTQTPHMDQLAAKGVNFTNAHCTSPGCSPSRNAVMFGIEPHNSGLYPFYTIQNITSGELDRLISIPQHFKNLGYTTVGLTKVFHNPDNKYREKETWDEYKYYSNNKLNLIKEKGYYPEPYKKGLTACPASNPKEDFQDYKIAVHAKRFLEEDHDKPFFLAVGFILPHTPFFTPEENYDRFDFPIEEPPIKLDDLTDIPMAGRANAKLYKEYQLRKDNAWEKVRRGYLAAISFTDDNVGVVMDALAESQYAENTIVVLWSDHGYHLGEKRSFSKFSLWNEATRSPFIIWDPRGQKGNGQACDEPVGLINVYKTLADLAGIETPDYVDGISLRPWLDNPQLEKESPAMTTWGRGNYTLRTKDWRYTRYFDGTEELYNETKDPLEWTNLADNPEYAAIKKQFADQWLPKTEAPQVKTGIELYNFVDADSPTHAYGQYNRYKKELKNDPRLPNVD